MRGALLIATLLCAVTAARASGGPCYALIGIAASGATYDERGSAWVRQSMAVVEETIQAGCYPENGPAPTANVTLLIAAGAPREKVEQMYKLLARNGWPKEKISTKVWTNAPRRPRTMGPHL